MSLALILLIKDAITKLVAHFKHKRKMSNRMERQADDVYEDEAKSPMGDAIPIERDEDVEESEMRPPYSNSDEQLGMCKLSY